MVVITRPRGKRPYVLLCDRKLPKAEQTTFYLTDLSEAARVAIMDSIEVKQGEGGATFSGSGTRVYLAVKAALVGWENLRDGDGKQVDFVTEMPGDPKVRRPSDDSLELLAWEHKQELQEEIMNASVPTEDDKEK